MNIAIWATNNEGAYVNDLLNFNPDNKVMFFIDNSKSTPVFCGLPVVEYAESVKNHSNNIDAIIIASKGQTSTNSIYYELKNNPPHKTLLYRFNTGYYYYKKSSTTPSDYLIQINTERICIPYLETHVADSCNLKCNGCAHFSNLHNKLKLVDFNSFCSDIDKIASIADLLQFRILGGELLLNPQLYKYIAYARKKFPLANISVVTNGLLIPQQDEMLFETMRNLNVGFDISSYPPIVKKKKEITAFLREKQVDFSFEFKPTSTFFKQLTGNKNNDAERANKSCTMRCLILREGKLFKCCIEAFIDDFSDYFGKKFDISRGVELYDETINWERAFNKLHSCPVEMCEFCTREKHEILWRSNGKPILEDWVV